MAGFFSKNAAKAGEGFLRRSLNRAQYEWGMTKWEAKSLAQEVRNGESIPAGLEIGLMISPFMGLSAGVMGAIAGHENAKKSNNGGFASAAKRTGGFAAGFTGGVAASFAAGPITSLGFFAALCAPRVFFPIVIAAGAYKAGEKLLSNDNSHVAQVQAAREKPEQAGPVRS